VLLYLDGACVDGGSTLSEQGWQSMMIDAPWPVRRGVSAPVKGFGCRQVVTYRPVVSWSLSASEASDEGTAGAG